MFKHAFMWLAVTLFPAALHAGQIYGSINSGGRAVANTPIEINCGGVVTSGGTVSDGSYRVNVQAQGQCTLTLSAYSGRPSAVVFSYPNPSHYDFELVEQKGGR